MVHRFRPHVMGAAVVLCVLAAACDAAEPDPSEETGGGGKADEVTDPAQFACQDVSGLGDLAELLDKHDPIAELLLKQGETCPGTYGEMLAKLRTLDARGCEDPSTDLQTRFVSDDARLGAGSPNYRTVTTRACSGREPGELIWTLLSVRPDENLAQRGFIEMAAFDPQAGVFNYYTMSGGGRWSFEADSIGLLRDEASCSACHPGGGIIMKELDDPWVHWESEGHPLPGVDAMFDNHGEQLGVRADGQSLEDVARSMNARLNQTRVQLLSAPGTGAIDDLLEPLFCPVEVNLDTAATAPGNPVEQIPLDLLLDPHFIDDPQAGIAIDDAVYEAAVQASGQSVPGFPDQPDTAIKLIFAERSGIDVDYVNTLLQAGVVDDDFVTDVLAIEFNRPLFSDARCDLLDFAPSLGDGSGAAVAAATPEAIREGFIANLQAAAPAPESAAGQLLTHLQDRDDAQAHRDAVAGYVEACRARPPAELMADVLAVVAGDRERTRGMSIIEHDTQLPRTPSAQQGLALDPVTCTLP